FFWPKIIWLQENEPDVVRNTGAFLNANDYLVFRLTGKKIADPLSAEKFYFEAGNGGYPRELFDYTNLSDPLFPAVQPIGSDLGPVLPDVARQIGLPEDVRVVLASYDAICAFWGSGVSKVGEACNVSGTSLSFRTLSNRPARRNNEGILSQYYAAQNVYIVGGSNNLEGGLLEWARECFYGDSYYNKVDYLYSLMQAEARKSSVGARGLVFVPYLIGERVPHWDSSARGVLFGLERFHVRSDIMRSIFESTGCITLSIIEAIERGGVPVNSIRMSGGLSRVPYACELRAHITGRPVHVLAEHETASLGAFMVVAQTAGWYQTKEELAQLTPIKHTYRPDPEIQKRYRGLYELFDEVYRNLKTTYQRRMGLVHNLCQDENQMIENL
ncbi:MAG: FGGY-family carbohydrate kinase, partial [Dehalococcoidia bacterium]